MSQSLLLPLFQKNPLIGAFFREIGRADELGSGVRNLMKLGKAYGGQEPELIEGDIFRTIVEIPDSGHLGKSAPKQLTGEVTGVRRIFNEADQLGLLNPVIEEIGMKIRSTVFLGRNILIAKASKAITESQLKSDQKETTQSPTQSKEKHKGTLCCQFTLLN